MAQHDYDVANGTGAVVRADINAVLGAIVSHNSGSSAPTTTFAYMLWADTTAGVMKMRNAGNTAWISLFSLSDGSEPANTIGNAQLRQSAGLSVIGRSANTTGDVADITAATDGHVLRLSGTTLGFGTLASGAFGANVVTDAVLRQGSALSVIGNGTNATANVSDIAAGTDGYVLRRSGTALAFGTLASGAFGANVVADTALRQSAGLSVIGRSANTTGNVADITAATDGHVLRLSGTTLAFGTLASGAFGANVVGNAAIRQSAGLSIIGNSSNVTANVSDITAVTDGHVLRLSGTTLGFGTLASAALAANIVTNAKLAQMANSTIKGRITAGTGDPEDLTAANVKTILALTKSDVGLANVDNTSDATKNAAAVTLTNKTIDASLNTLSNISVAMMASTAVVLAASGIGTNNVDTKFPTSAAVKAYVDAAVASGVADGDKGDIVVSSGGTVYTIDTNVVTDAKLRTSAATSVIGRSGATSGNVADIAAATDGHVLRLSGTTLAFGTLASGAFGANVVGNDAIRQSAGLSVIGNSTNATANVSDITAANDGEVLRRSGTAIGFGTLATGALAANIVTNAKLAQMATQTFKGRNTAGTGDPEDLSVATVKTMLSISTVTDSAVLLKNATATVSVGYTLTSYSAGTISTGTFTPDPANQNYQYYTNNGAHTLAAPASDCAIDILVTNGATAGSITFSGFTIASGNTGDALTTTNTSKFIISIRRINGVSTYVIKALQ